MSPQKGCIPLSNHKIFNSRFGKRGARHIMVSDERVLPFGFHLFMKRCCLGGVRVRGGVVRGNGYFDAIISAADLLGI